MMRLVRKNRLFHAVALALCAQIALSGCVFTRDGVAPAKLDPATPGKPQRIKVATKAHLNDGSVILFEKGFTLEGGVLRGEGDRSDLMRRERQLVHEVPLAEVAALESYRRETRPVATFFGLVIGVPVAAATGLVLFKLIFGSCPTVYAPTPEGDVLEAELFSHSITRRFEGTDTDRLEVARPSGGEMRLRMRNEALETHYVNRLELLAADGPPGFEAFSTPDDRVVLLGRQTPLREVRSRRGRAAGEEIAVRDGVWYRGGEEVERALAEAAEDDWLEGEVTVPAGAETVTVALRGRNTLLDTVLLYDTLLASQGVGALEWLERFERNPLAALRWHRWFERRFGLRVLMDSGEGYEEVARFPVTGPISWHQAAVTFPAPRSANARLRLQSLGDNWQIDWVGVSFESAPAAEVTAVAPARIAVFSGGPHPDALASLRAADADYLVTGPGDSLELVFPAGEAPAGRHRTFFLKSRGYYIEWLRNEWLTAAAAGGAAAAPAADDAAILQAGRRWVARKEVFEKEFFSSRIGAVPGAPR